MRTRSQTVHVYIWLGGHKGCCARREHFWDVQCARPDAPLRKHGRTTALHVLQWGVGVDFFQDWDLKWAHPEQSAPLVRAASMFAVGLADKSLEPFTKKSFYPWLKAVYKQLSDEMKMSMKSLACDASLVPSSGPPKSWDPGYFIAQVFKGCVQRMQRNAPRVV